MTRSIIGAKRIGNATGATVVPALPPAANRNRVGVAPYHDQVMEHAGDDAPFRGAHTPLQRAALTQSIQRRVGETGFIEAFRPQTT